MVWHLGENFHILVKDLVSPVNRVPGGRSSRSISRKMVFLLLMIDVERASELNGHLPNQFPNHQFITMLIISLVIIFVVPRTCRTIIVLPP